MGRHFPVREKSGNFEQTGKVRENHTKCWKTEINWDKYYFKFLVIFKWTVHFLVKWIKFSVKKNKTLKKYWKMAKNTGKVREFCQSGKVGTLFKAQVLLAKHTLFWPIMIWEAAQCYFRAQLCISLQLDSEVMRIDGLWSCRITRSWKLSWFLRIKRTIGFFDGILGRTIHGKST